MSRKVYVTASEMRTMREQGMSNRDIANALDISYSTVVNYIGKQGCKMDSLQAFRDTPPKKTTVKEEPVMIPKYQPKPIIERFKIGGFDVELDGEDRDVTIASDEDVIVISYEAVPDLVQFLAWAMRERMEAAVDEQTKEVQE
jgi:transposase